MNKLLSVVIPTIGREAYLDISLSSLLPQEAFDEIVVFDNSTQQQLQRGSQWGGHPSVRWERSGGGLPPIESWNSAVRACQTPWVTIFGDDDVAGPEFGAQLRKQMHEAGLIYAPFHLIDEVGRQHRDLPPIPESSDHDTFRHRRMRGQLYCVIPGFAFRREDFLEVGGFRRLGLPNDLYCDDDLWFRLGAKAGRVNVVQARTWSYRRHATQVARKFDLRGFITGFDGFARELEAALGQFDVPMVRVYPGDMGREGYKQRILAERFSLWLRQVAGTDLSLTKEILTLPVPWAQRLPWLMRGYAATLSRWLGAGFSKK